MPAPGRFVLDPGLRVFATDLRLSWPTILRRAGLPGDLVARGAASLSVEEYYRFWSALEIEGRDRNLVADLAGAISAEAFAPPILAALCSQNLRTAIDRIATYKPLVGPLHLATTDEPDGSLRVEFDWPQATEPPALLAASELIFWPALARIATRHRVNPVSATAPSVPPDPAVLESVLGARIRVATTYSVTFSAVDLDRPFVTANEQMWRFYAPELRKRLSDLDARATVADRVRAALHETLPAGGSTIDAVTRALATSPRTLQRQLSAEGTTYQAVLADTREQLARHYLTRGRLRTSEVAYLLGYDDATSFYRAFRTWTGSTPDAVKNAAAGRTAPAIEAT